ncbi:MAG TPA: hypothetical protein VMF52_06395 [Steroidobacteraceae bacterium]|nr:hypothetical protein [Steroidobacteraceae bacterium]
MATEEQSKSITQVIYGLYAASLVVGITSIVAIILNYVKKDDVVGTLYESHFRWQIRTFWFGLLWSVIGIILTMVVVGIFVLIGAGIWFIYRIVVGWLRLSEGKPMYA